MKKNLSISEERKKQGLRSELVKDVISTKPGFMVRYGIGLFAFVVFLLLIVCWFIQYPDIVQTSAKLTSVNAPKEIVTRISGKLVKLFVKEGDPVEKGSILGYMESIADHGEMIKLTEDIDALVRYMNQSEVMKLPGFPDNRFEHLGELQQDYQVFRRAYILYSNYLEGGLYLKKRAMLVRDMGVLKRANDNLMAQKELNAADLALTQKTFEANQLLNKEKVISDFEYRAESSKLISKKLQMPLVDASIISNESLQNEKQKEIMELNNTILQQRSIFSQALYTFKSQLTEWKQKYLLVAPVAGKVSFATLLQENQQLQVNQILCFINPGNTQYYAEILVPQENSGKVSLGQEVLLKFPAYPFQEFGIVSGRIDFISSISSDSGSLALVVLPEGLLTSHKQKIRFRDGLLAKGEIITNDLRLLERFYYQLKKQLNR